ncbi:MAG: hypothetical protein RDU14_10035 [Melioribacteraceae bacterium]|nr:hypothetical protein [Melioribacteraceae bacterium]
MLEKVLNINPGSDYKKSTGNPKYYKKVSGYQNSFTSANDSLYISPATSLLASLGWKIKKLNKDSEKIQIMFELDGFDFEASIFINDLNQNAKIDYRAKKNLERFATEVLITVILTAPIISVSSELESNIKLNGFSRFFDQFESTRFKKPSLITEKNIIETLYYDVRKEITEEFNLINSCFVSFLEKYISLKPVFHHSTGDESVIIKSIHVQ